MSSNKQLKDNFIKHLNKNFDELKENSKDKISILVEFHGWSFAHICYAYLLSALKKKYPGKIYAYEGYRLITNSLKLNIYDKTKWILGQKLNLKNFGIYNSLGVEKFLSPKIDKKILSQVKKKSVDLNFKSKNQFSI